MSCLFWLAGVVLLLSGVSVFAQTPKPPESPTIDAQLAKRLGADERGMKSYVMVILKTGPAKVEAGKERDEIFKGHFANIMRLAKEGKLVVAGPFDDNNDWRGMFIFNVTTVEEAKALTDTDPVVKSGVMVPEFHKLYCTAALMEINGIHERIAQQAPGN